LPRVHSRRRVAQRRHLLEGKIAMNPSITERRIRWASLLVGAGLVVQLASLLIVHPLAFVAFLMVGCPLMAAGIVLYLVSLLP
jgi:hypothetical protein